MAIRVVVAEDDYLVREGVKRLLDEHANTEFVAAYPDPAPLLENLEHDAPDVVITDIRMPPGWQAEGIALARELLERAPTVGVIVLSQVARPDYLVEIFAGGHARRAYLLKERVTDSAGLLRVIEDVAGGGSFVDPEVVATLVHVHEGAGPITELSPRERDVLELMAGGLSNTVIAERLFLSKRSVEGHINSIFAKLGLPDEENVSRRVAAVLLYLADAAR